MYVSSRLPADRVWGFSKSSLFSEVLHVSIVLFFHVSDRSRERQTLLCAGSLRGNPFLEAVARGQEVGLTGEVGWQRRHHSSSYSHWMSASPWTLCSVFLHVLVPQSPCLAMPLSQAPSVWALLILSTWGLTIYNDDMVAETCLPTARARCRFRT